MVEIPQVIAARAPQQTRVAAADFGAGVGRANEQLGRAAARLGQATTQIAGALLERKDRAALSAAAIEIEKARDEFENDPDFETAEDRFGARLDQIQERAAQDGVGLARFDREFNQMAERAKLQLGDVVRPKMVSAARAAGRQEAEDYARLAAQARTDADREFYTLLAQNAVDGMEADGVLTPEQAVEDRRVVDRSISLGELAELQRRSPGLALEELLDEGGTLTRGLSEQERQNEITRTVRLINSQRQSALALEEAQAKAIERQRKELQADEVREFIRLASPDGEGLTVERVERFGDDLDPAVLEKWRGIAARGGRAAPANVSGTVRLQLRRRIQQGDPTVVTEIEGMVERFEMDETLAISLLDKAEEARFGPARDFLEAGAKAAEVRGIPGQAMAIERGIQELDDWIVRPENRGATKDQAREKAEEIADRIDVLRIVDDTLSHPFAANYTRTPDGKIDFDANRRRFVAENVEGRLSDEEFERVVEDLDRREEQERLRRERQSGGANR